MKYKVKVMDSMPCVGPFFVISDKLIAHPVKLTEAEEYQGTYNDRLSHNDLYYKHIAPMLGLSQRSEWEQFPRGRVVAKTMKNGTKKYYVFMDKCILYKSNIRDQIVNEYQLPFDNIVWKTDSHYKCANCGAAVMPDLDEYDDLY